MIFSTKYFYKIYFFVLAALCFKVYAQDAHPAFKQYDTEAGLASSKVYQVKQDSKGYIWFATNNGVSRFNGYEFENFSIADGLPDNTVFEIFEDKKGRVWFLPLSNRLSYFYNGKIHQFKYNKLLLEKLKTRPLKTSFCVDDKGTIFIGLVNYGICSITEQGVVKITHTLNRSKNAMVVFEPVKQCFIYASNSKAINNTGFEFKTKKISGEISLDYGLDKGPHSPRIISLKNGTIAISLNNNLYFFDGGHTYEKNVFDHRICWLYEDKDGDLWIGTFLGGVYHIHNKDFKNKKHYLAGFIVTGVLEDREGGIWFTTEGNSVYYTSSKHVLTYDKESGLKDSRVNCLTSSENSVFIGLQNSFIQEIEPSGNIVSYNCKLNNESFDDIAHIYYDHKNAELWYSGGVSRGIIKNGKSRIFTDVSFYELIPSGTNSYYGASASGIVHYVDQNLDRSSNFYPGFEGFKRTNAILQKNKHTLFVGAIDGLWEFSTVKYTYKYIGNRDSLLQNRILDLAYTKDSALLIATKGAGLLIFENNKVNQINIAKGLSSENVLKLIVDDSVIWAATDKGLSKIIRRKNGNIDKIIRVFTTYDGLISNEIDDIMKFDHKIWIASDKGVSFFNPDSLDKGSVELPVYINNILINDSNVSVNNKYQLNHFENNIKIKFIALGFKNARNLQYRYKMEGLDTNWVYTMNREIQFTTLPPGRYKFIVTVLNSSGKWTSKVGSVEFVISTPFWKTWWFLLLLIVLVISMTFYITSYLIQKRQKEKNKTEEVNKLLLNLKLKALRAQMNPHFIFNVINSIQHFILYKNDEAAHRYLTKFSKLIRTILNNSEQNVVLLSDEIKALELYLELEAMRFEKRFEYEVLIDDVLDVNKIKIPSMLIQPYVENAIKHGILPSLTIGKIKIEILKHQNLLKCIIEDNGVGRQESFKKNVNNEYRSFGTTITKERLFLINELYNRELSEKVIDLFDNDGNPIGTKVEIFIPFNLD